LFAWQDIRNRLGENIRPVCPAGSQLFASCARLDRWPLPVAKISRATVIGDNHRQIVNGRCLRSGKLLDGLQSFLVRVFNSW